MKSMRSIREARGLTLADLEGLTGISRYQLGRYENGHQDPSTGRAQKVARALGVSLDSLVEGEAATASTPRG